MQPTSQPTSEPSSQPTRRPTNRPTSQPVARPTAYPTPEPSYSQQPTQAVPRNWMAQLGTTMYSMSLGIAVLNGKTVLGGGVLPGFCLEFSNFNGAFLSGFDMPWDITIEMIGIDSTRVAFLGRNNLNSQYTVGIFDTTQQKLTLSVVSTSSQVQWSCVSVNPDNKALILVGTDSSRKLLVVQMNPDTGVFNWGYKYSLLPDSLYPSVVTSLGLYEGNAILGYAIDSSYGAKLLVLNTDYYGRINYIMEYARSDVSANRQSNFPLSMKMASDGLIVVGYTYDANNNANAFMTKIKVLQGISSIMGWSFEIKGAQSSNAALTDVFIQDDIAIMVGYSNAFNNGQTSAIFLKVSTATGQILASAGVTGPNLVCNAIAAADDGYELACQSNGKPTVLFIDGDTLATGVLMPGYQWFSDISSGLTSYPLNFVRSLTISSGTGTYLSNNPFQISFDTSLPLLSVTSSWPENLPTYRPTRAPTIKPSMFPSSQPSSQPTGLPSSRPTSAPTARPTVQPTYPSSVSKRPTRSPTLKPSAFPTIRPTPAPSYTPTDAPSASPSVTLTRSPTINPSNAPSRVPTRVPSVATTRATRAPTTGTPTVMPSAKTDNPTMQPTKDKKNNTGLYVLIGFGGGLAFLFSILMVSVYYRWLCTPCRFLADLWRRHRVGIEEGGDEQQDVGIEEGGDEQQDAFDPDVEAGNGAFSHGSRDAIHGELATGPADEAVSEENSSHLTSELDSGSDSDDSFLKSLSKPHRRYSMFASDDDSDASNFELSPLHSSEENEQQSDIENQQSRQNMRHRMFLPRDDSDASSFELSPLHSSEEGEQPDVENQRLQQSDDDFGSISSLDSDDLRDVERAHPIKKV
jgi:hypothetical protein